MSVLSFGTTETELIEVHDPQELQVDLQDVDAAGAGRNANGTMIRDRVAGGASAKRKLEVKWPPLPLAEIKTILQAIDGVFFYIRYPDPYVGDFRTGLFYAGDRTAPMYTMYTGEPLWESLSVNFIEK